MFSLTKQPKITIKHKIISVDHSFNNFHADRMCNIILLCFKNIGKQDKDTERGFLHYYIDVTAIKSAQSLKGC